MGTATAPSRRILAKSAAKARRNAGRKAPASRRTTVTLSPESQEIVERFKSASGTSTSAAVDRIILRSEPKPSRLKNVNGFLVIDQPQGRLNITLEDVKRAEDEMDREYVERIMYRRREAAPKKRRTGLLP